MPSSVIAAMHYDPERRVLMIVYRGNRGRYRYFDVPPEEWQEFGAAKSKGTYLNEKFKRGGYRYEKVSETQIARVVLSEQYVQKMRAKWYLWTKDCPRTRTLQGSVRTHLARA